MDSTLQAVIVGGVIAGVPALLAAWMNVRSVEALSRSERDEQRRVSRAEMYATFIDTVPSSEAKMAALQEALLELELRGTKEIPEADGAGEWLVRFERQIARLRFLGSREVREAAERLEQTFHQLIQDLAEILPDFNEAELARIKAYEDAAGNQLKLSPWQQRYDALAAAMRRDIDTL